MRFGGSSGARQPGRPAFWSGNNTPTTEGGRRAPATVLGRQQFPGRDTRPPRRSLAPRKWLPARCGASRQSSQDLHEAQLWYLTLCSPDSPNRRALLQCYQLARYTLSSAVVRAIRFWGCRPARWFANFSFAIHTQTHYCQTQPPNPHSLPARSAQELRARPLCRVTPRPPRADRRGTAPATPDGPDPIVASRRILRIPASKTAEFHPSRPRETAGSVQPIPEPDPLGKFC